MKKLAIITTHPIQYNAPMFALLNKRGIVKPKIFYTWGETVLQQKYDPGFKKVVEWDIPLLEGYDYTFVNNVAKDAGSHHFSGIDNPSLIKQIEDWGADAVLVYGWSFKSHLRAMRYFHKRRAVFFRGDSTLLVKMSSLKKVLRTVFLKWVYSKVNIALYVGTNNKQYYLKYGLKEKQLLFAPHAIDNDRFSGNDEVFSAAANSWKKELGIPENETVFLFAAKLVEDKNAELLIRAFQELKQSNIHLIIAGSGEQEQYLKDTYGRIPNIYFLPFQNQSRMPVLYRLGDVFIFPSKYDPETWGLAINEAMACGKAVVASDTCGASVDLIRNGKNGYTFKNNNLQDLKDKLELLVENKALVIQMGHASAEMIASWSFDSVCKAIEEAVAYSTVKH